jgi:hypothetical protein
VARELRLGGRTCGDDDGLSRETLNLAQMMGKPNRTPEPISRSWSFCADAIWLA